MKIKLLVPMIAFVLFSSIVFAINAVQFDGATFVTRGAQITGIADGTQYTRCVWLKPTSGDGTAMEIDSNQGNIFDNGFRSSKMVEYSDYQIVKLTGSTTVGTSTGWYLYCVSVNSGGTNYMYINNTAESITTTYNTGANIDFTRTNWGLGAWSPGGSPGGFYTGCMANYWFDAVYVDFSNASTRAKFITADNKAADLGTDGSTPTGNSPLIYLNGDSANFGTNKGTGGDFTATAGSLSNCSDAPPAESSAPDTTPPNILHYNLSTPSGDCTVWNTSKSTACSTGDTTPTISIKTDDAANCAIGLEDKNFAYYDGLGVNRSCENGGTTSLVCSLRPQDELTYEDSIVYIGCKNTNGYENATSTSGPLSLMITGLEASGDSSISIGVQNALLNSYTNYTSLQIYARNLSNNQVKGTFDWAAKKGSKLWAFNYVTKGEQHVNMFNLTPVLYTLELANKTSSNITLEVEKLINATK